MIKKCNYPNIKHGAPTFHVNRVIFLVEIVSIHTKKEVDYEVGDSPKYSCIGEPIVILVQKVHWPKI